MDTSDITDGSFTAPMNFDSVENFEIIVGGFDAQYNSMGFVQNVVTKGGSNKFTYDVNLTWSPPALTAKNTIPQGQPAEVGIYTNNNVANPLHSFLSPVLNIGGPIIKDRLWFFISGQMNRNVADQIITNFYEPNPENRAGTTWTDIGSLKLTWQPTSADIFSVRLNIDRNRIYNADDSNFTTPSGEYKIVRGGYMIVGNYSHTFSDRVLFQLQLGSVWRSTDTDPEFEGTPHFDVTNRVTQGSALSQGGSTENFIPYGANFQHEIKERLEFDPTLSVNAGAHQIKGGIQTSFMMDSQLAGISGSQYYQDNRNPPVGGAQGGLCDPNNPSTFPYCYQRVDVYNAAGNAAPQLNTAQVSTIAGFIQDRWTISKKVTLVPGFRLDTGLLFGDNGFFTPLIGYGPRIALTYDPLGDHKPLITAHYGRSNDVGNILVAQFANPSLTGVTSNFTGGAFPQCYINSPPPACLTSAGVNKQFSTGQSPPHVDEVQVGYRQEAAPKTVLGADLSFRLYQNEWAQAEVNRIYDFSGTQVVGYVNPKIQASVLRAETPNNAYRQYEGLDLWVQGNPGSLGPIGKLYTGVRSRHR